MADVSSEIFHAVWEVVTRRSFDRAEAATALGLRLVQSLGQVQRDEDDILAGGRALSRDRELLSGLATSCGLGFCLYAGNRRIATSTVLDAGTAPALGGFAHAELANRVLRRSETFKGTLLYDGREYIVVARPLFATGGERFSPIGLIEAFQDKQAHIDLMAAAARAGIEGQLADLAARSDAFESIIEYIDDTARRLQLLALNGNIIAASAGSHGRAFRVVCRELGTLADRSKHTAAEVRRAVADYADVQDEAAEAAISEEEESSIAPAPE